jgi:hypothetical protein
VLFKTDKNYLSVSVVRIRELLMKCEFGSNGLSTYMCLLVFSFYTYTLRWRSHTQDPIGWIRNRCIRGPGQHFKIIFKIMGLNMHLPKLWFYIHVLYIMGF